MTEKGEGETPLSVKKELEGVSLRTTRWKGRKGGTKDRFIREEVAIGDGFVEGNGIVGSSCMREKVLLAIGKSGWVFQLGREEEEEWLFDEGIGAVP